MDHELKAFRLHAIRHHSTQAGSGGVDGVIAWAGWWPERGDGLSGTPSLLIQQGRHGGLEGSNVKTLKLSITRQFDEFRFNQTAPTRSFRHIGHITPKNAYIFLPVLAVNHSVIPYKTVAAVFLYFHKWRVLPLPLFEEMLLFFTCHVETVQSQCLVMFVSQSCPVWKLLKVKRRQRQSHLSLSSFLYC